MLNFVAGETSKNFTVTIIGDDKPEEDEDFTVAMTFFDNYSWATAGATTECTITILDDDTVSVVIFVYDDEQPGLRSPSPPRPSHSSPCCLLSASTHRPFQPPQEIEEEASGFLNPLASWSTGTVNRVPKSKILPFIWTVSLGKGNVLTTYSAAKLKRFKPNLKTISSAFKKTAGAGLQALKVDCAEFNGLTRVDVTAFEAKTSKLLFDSADQTFSVKKKMSKLGCFKVTLAWGGKLLDTTGGVHVAAFEVVKP